MLDDFRFGLRTLGRSPGFTLVAVAVLALGIGINAAVFSLVNGVLFKNLPFHDSERVLYLVSAGSHQKRGLFGVSYPDFRDFQTHEKSLSSAASARIPSASAISPTRRPSRRITDAVRSRPIPSASLAKSPRWAATSCPTTRDPAPPRSPFSGTASGKHATAAMPV